MELVIIADDLTGSNDSSAQFLRGDRSVCTVLPGVSREDLVAAAQTADLLVFDTESRDLNPAQAGDVIAETFGKSAALMQNSGDDFILYKKVDSTLRGNVGVELQSLIECYRPDITIFAPAFIEAGRTTLNGKQLLNGVELQNTELAKVPKSAVTTSVIAEILAKNTNLTAIGLSLTAMTEDAEALAAELLEFKSRGNDVFVCDATSREHLSAVAAAGLELMNRGFKVLFAGSAGLSGAIAAQLPAVTVRSRKPASCTLAHADGRIVYLSGSISAVTRGQCSELIEKCGVATVEIDPWLAVTDPAAAAMQAVSQVNACHGAQAVLVSAALDEKAVEISKTTALSLGLTFADAGTRMAEVMAQIAKSVAADFDALVMTGGDTAVHACQAIGAQVIEVLGQIQPGVPVCALRSGAYQGKKLISKAGAFGSKDAFVQAYEYLNRGEHMRKPVLGITMGDPAGIGSEITVKALSDPKLYEIARPVVFGDAAQLERAAKIAGIDIKIHAIDSLDDPNPSEHQIEVVDLKQVPADIPFGKIDARCGKAAFAYIEAAVKAAMDHKIHAIVTAPLNKEALHAGGCPHPGHTEILANLTGTKDYSMMLDSPKLRVIHVSTHVSLRQACDKVKKDRVLRVIKLADETLKLMGYDNPRIAVAGLNPHCGESGLFGNEDDLEIRPAVAEAVKQGMNVTGPVAPDTVFHRAANKGEFDIVVVMYHDQGHIPLKVLGFNDGVNVTVGLPCIRTSVDHGTAFEIAGKGIADPHSMTAALNLGAQMAKVKFRSLLEQ